MADRYYGMVYEPPSLDFPYLAVIFGPDGRVQAAHPVASVQAGESLITTVLAGLKKMADDHSKKKKGKKGKG